MPQPVEMSGPLYITAVVCALLAIALAPLCYAHARAAYRRRRIRSWRRRRDR